MHRAAEDKAVCTGGFLQKFVHGIIHKAFSPVLQASGASQTAGQGLGADVEYFCFHAVFVQDAGHLGKSGIGAAFLVRAAVYQDYFHID